MIKKALACLAAIALFTACNNDIEYTEPDNKTDMIQFSVASIDAPASSGKAKVASRAGEHTHIAWNDDYHANTLGVFGYGDGKLSNVIFDNQKATATYADSKWFWRPSADKYWAEFTQYSSFDFFGYMLEDDDLAEGNLPAATITKDGSNFTLSFPATLSAPILLSGDNTPLICHAPHRTTVPGFAIPFQMDQTLTGYDIQFQLGEKMSKLRYFVIKSVKVYGENLPVGGTVSRTYTLTDGVWKAEAVTWNVVTKASIAAGDADAIPLAPEWPTESNKADRTISAVNTTWVKWGGSDLGKGAFYAIPHTDFQPTIEVTYDVYTDADANGEGGTLSRKNVKSTIVLNKTNFESLALGTTGEIQHINIKIVPDYLYVLSDDDQVTGFLIATE